MAEDAAGVAAAYFDAWRRDDFDAIRNVLADDVEFTGPLGQTHNADDYLEGLRSMSKTDLVVRKTFVDGDDVLTWFDLHTSSSAPLPTANWTQVENGRINNVRVTFDASSLNK